MLHQLSERDADRLLAGEQPRHRPDLVEVAQFVATLRTSGEADAPPMRPQLLAELDAAEAHLRSRPSAPPTQGNDEVSRRRAEAQGLAGNARRRWRLLGAAAMVAMLCGIVAAHAHVALLPSDEPTRTTDVGPSDRQGSMMGTDDKVPTPTAPSVTTTLPPPTTPPPTQPAPPAQATESEGRGDRDSGGRDHRRGDEDRREGDHGQVFVPGQGWVDLDELCGYSRDGNCWSGEVDWAWEWWYESGRYGP